MKKSSKSQKEKKSLEQLLLFEESPIDKMRYELSQLIEKFGKYNRSQFAQITEIRKLYVELREEVDQIKCKAALHDSNKCKIEEFALF